MTASRNPHVFVVGCPRSGTTLLRRMLDAHPELAITPETHWIPQHVGRPLDEVVECLLASPKFERTGLGRSELTSLLRTDPAPSYAEFARGFFDLYGHARGKAVVGDKTPGYVRHLPLLSELFPHVRFVHLIRDGRDVALSALAWSRWPKLARQHSIPDATPVETAARWWEQNVRPGREAGGSLGAGRYHEVRYETLVAAPTAAIEPVCAFLGIAFHDEMVRFDRGRRRSEPGLGAKKAWLPPTPGLRNWATEMPVDDVERFEIVGGGLLDELGYERARTAAQGAPT